MRREARRRDPNQEASCVCVYGRIDGIQGGMWKEELEAKWKRHTRTKECFIKRKLINIDSIQDKVLTLIVKLGAT